MSSKLITNIIAGVVIMVFVALGYNYLFSKSVTPDTTDGGINIIDITQPGTGESENIADQFSRLLASIKDINFAESGKVLSRPDFVERLQDFSRPLPEIASYRSNPFAPVEGLASSYIRYSAPIPTPTQTTTPAPSPTAGQ